MFYFHLLSISKALFEDLPGSSVSQGSPITAAPSSLIVTAATPVNRSWYLEGTYGVFREEYFSFTPYIYQKIIASRVLPLQTFRDEIHLL